jgi:hypothetical protein
MTDPTEPPDDFDVVMPLAPTEDAGGARVVRMRPGEMSLAELRPVQEGKPCMGGAEIVRLEPRPEAPRAYDVRVLYRAPAAPPPAKGPAQVATKAYRDSWERTFRERPN